jgi:hypothetical protein
MRGAIIVAVVLGATAVTASAKPGVAFIPPMEIELGQVVTASASGRQIESTQLLIGVSWASLWPKDTPVDFSVGVICNMTPVPLARDKLSSGMTGPQPGDVDTDAGPFVDLAVRTARGGAWRSWLGARGELIDQGDVSALGVAARASVEIWVPVKAADGGGNAMAAIVGTFALSAWAEAGLREQPHGAASFVAAGLGARIPFLIVAGG